MNSWVGACVGATASARLARPEHEGHAYPADATVPQGRARCHRAEPGPGPENFPWGGVRAFSPAGTGRPEDRRSRRLACYSGWVKVAVVDTEGLWDEAA